MTKRVTILTWLVGLLLLMNIATIATILYHRYAEKKQEEMVSISLPGGNQHNLNGRYLRQQLGFDDAQMEGFRAVNRSYRPQAAQLTFTIDSLKNEMFAELNNARPDTVKLTMLSQKIGTMHGELKAVTFRYCMHVKKIGVGHQQQEIQKIFAPLFINDAFPAGQPTPRGPRGWRHGQL